MKDYFVKDLMVTLSEYATILEGSTLLEAMLTLEKTQTKSDNTKYTHRSILVLNPKKKVLGKLDISDVLRAFGPQSDDLNEFEELEKFGFSTKFMQYILAQRHGTANAFQKVSEKKVEAFMQTPSKGEYVDQDVPIKVAIHQLVIGDHLALFVTKNKNITGILRLTDVFAAVFHTMKACESST